MRWLHSLVVAGAAAASPRLEDAPGPQHRLSPHHGLLATLFAAQSTTWSTDETVCPTETEVLSTPPVERWRQWAASGLYLTPEDQFGEPPEHEVNASGACPCRLPRDGISCGKGIGPCCVRRARAFNPQSVLAAPELLRETVDDYNCSAAAAGMDTITSEGLAKCIVQAALSSDQDVNFALPSALQEAAALASRHAQSCTYGAPCHGLAPQVSHRQARQMRRIIHSATRYARRRTLEMRQGGNDEGADTILSTLAHLRAANARLIQRTSGTFKEHRQDLFLHISKAGGSSFIQMARDNMYAGQYPNNGVEKVPTGEVRHHNALWLPGDGPMWCCSMLAFELSCTARLERYQQNGFVMTAMERYLDNSGALCEGIEYATLLRDPARSSLAGCTLSAC